MMANKHSMRFLRYSPDNKGAVPFVSPHTGRMYKGGFGGLLFSSRLYRVSTNSVARKIRAAITLAAAAAEGKAQASYIEPGHVTKTFKSPSIERTLVPYKLKTGHVNPRYGAKISVSGTTQPGDRDEEGFAYNLRSDPIVLEAGSKYNEGSRTDRPALRIMANAAKTMGALPGVRVETS